MPVSRQPNIVFVVFDALSATDSGMLTASPTVPTLSALRDRSALFASAYAPSPESGPARASLFTGLDPFVHGVWTNGVALRARERTFPEILAQAGYTNWLVGRRQLAGVANWTTEYARPGEYAHVEWAHGPLYRSRQNAYLIWLRETAPEHYARVFPLQANADATEAGPEQHAAIAELPDDLGFNHWVGQRIQALISAHPSDRPFLAVTGFTVGTSMGAAPPPGGDGESVSGRALQQADAALGRILGLLAADTRAEDTVVFVTAARGNAATGTTDEAMNETSIRVPLLLHRPGQKRRDIAAPVSTMDIAPTVLDVAGLPIGPRFQGRSLLPVIDGSQAPRGWAMSRLRRGLAAPSRDWQTAFRADGMKLVVRHGDPQTRAPATYRLFDLGTDPGECEDLAGQAAYAGVLEDMIDQMIDARCALEDRTEPRIAEF